MKHEFRVNGIESPYIALGSDAMIMIESGARRTAVVPIEKELFP
jgi:hypothetical protein